MQYLLKVLKARCPEQYNTQRIETKSEVKAEVEHKDENIKRYILLKKLGERKMKLKNKGEKQL